MRKSAERALNKELNVIITASDYKIVKESFNRLINLADILDGLGDEKDADRIDQIVKEAAGIWDFLLSGLGGAATTKDEGGKSILDAIKGGNIGEFFSKETLVKVITNFLVGGGIGLLAGELVEVVTEKVPVLKWFGDSKFIKMAIEGALTYAVMHSDFVTKLVDGIVQQVEGVLGMKTKEAPKPATPAPAAPTPASTPAPAVAKQPSEGTDTASFQVAPPVPGAKS